MIHFPSKAEYAPFYDTYVSRVPKTGLLEQFEHSAKTFTELLARIPDDKWDYQYQPGKWTIKELILHINDTERVMAYRALWIARNCPIALPGFDQDEFVLYSNAANRTKASLITEFNAIRKSTAILFSEMEDITWKRVGIASDNPISVRALACIILGHQIHHVQVLKDRYL